MSLKQLDPGLTVAVARGAQGLSDPKAYELRGRAVFVCFDDDYAGFKGALDAAEKLKEVKADPIIIEFPETLGHDLNDALVNKREQLEQWFRERQLEYSRTDEVYVQELFADRQAPLIVIPTGLTQWDEIMRGGLGPGAHVIMAEPKAGKSALANDIEVKAAELHGFRVLEASYELSKRQCWARKIAHHSGIPWADIEAHPEFVPQESREWARELSQKVRTVVGWTVGQIRYVADSYDLIVVDYLQRMPGPYGSTDLSVRMNVDYNISALSDLGRDLGKVVLVVSEVPKSEYGKKFTKGSAKESGAIEYRAASVTGLKRGQGDTKVWIDVVANTRGQERGFMAQVDLATQRYTDLDSPAQKQTPSSVKSLGSTAVNSALSDAGL
jgi:hypothetical protein